MVKRVCRYVVVFWKCKVWRYHKWTCASLKGIDITEEQATSKCGLWEYAKMYCDRCGHVSALSTDLIEKCKNRVRDKREIEI